MGGYAGREWDRMLLPPFHAGRGISDERWREVFGRTGRMDDGGVGEDKDGGKDDGMMGRVKRAMGKVAGEDLAIAVEIERGEIKP
jgi:hypothetical protein